MYLALEPAGAGQLDEGGEIPVERTSSPYDVVEAFEGLAETSERDRHRPARGVADHAGRPHPQHPRGVPRRRSTACPGCRRTSPPATSRSTRLLGNLERVSTVLDERDQDIVELMKDSDVLFRALVARREAVHDLLVVHVDAVAGAHRAGRAEPRRPQARARPTSRTSSQVLNKNEDNLDNSLRLMAPFYRVFANTLGTGPWFDTYIQNLPPVPAGGVADMARLAASASSSRS